MCLGGIYGATLCERESLVLLNRRINHWYVLKLKPVREAVFLTPIVYRWWWSVLVCMFGVIVPTESIIVRVCVFVYGVLYEYLNAYVYN